MSYSIVLVDGIPSLMSGKNGYARNGHANGHASAEQTPFQEKRAEQAKAHLTYDAARSGTDLDGHWAHADSLAADTANSPQVRRNLRNRSRYETGSNGLYAGSLKTHTDLFIGNETGPALRMLTGNREFNQAIEKAWFAWTQQIQLHRKLRCMFHSRVQDGEVFGLLINNPELPDVQLDLLLIEADQVQSTVFSVDRKEVDGIHLDENNNVVAYDILPEHPGGNAFLSSDAITIPARDVIHWFKLERPSAHRGKPDMTSTLPVGATNRRMREATVTSVEAAASVAGVAYSQLSPAGNDEPDPVAPFKPFQIPRRSGLTMPMGWQLDQMAALHPNAQYSEFHRQQLSEMVSPIGQPYNVAAHDSSTYSFASGKLDTLAYRAALNIERGDCNILVLDRLFAAWFREWTLIQRAEFTPAHQWDWPLHPVIDAVSEASATDTKLKNGTLQLRQAYSDQGQDLEDQLAIMAEDTFGEASEENVAKCRKIMRLINTPQHAIEQVSQLLGIKAPEPKQPAAPPAMQEVDDDEQPSKLGWVTLDNGVHIEIGEDGNIEKGPASMRGKTVDQVKNESATGTWPTPAVKVSSAKTKINIDQASQALDRMGWKLGAPIPWKPGDKETRYKITHKKTGKVVEKSAKEISQVIS